MTGIDAQAVVVYQGTSVGSFAFVSCNIGYATSGNGVYSCLSDSSWAPSNASSPVSCSTFQQNFSLVSQASLDSLDTHVAIVGDIVASQFLPSALIVSTLTTLKGMINMTFNDNILSIVFSSLVRVSGDILLLNNLNLSSTLPVLLW